MLLALEEALELAEALALLLALDEELELLALEWLLALLLEEEWSSGRFGGRHAR